MDIQSEWDQLKVTVVIADDGPGFRAEVFDNLGEPYVTTRPADAKKGDGETTSGLGLGFFIAKTLLERSGARIALENHQLPRHGAIVRIVWPRKAFEANATGAAPFAPVSVNGSRETLASKN